jgi:hypothetical protein
MPLDITVTLANVTQGPYAQVSSSDSTTFVSFYYEFVTFVILNNNHLLT